MRTHLHLTLLVAGVCAGLAGPAAAKADFSGYWNLQGDPMKTAPKAASTPAAAKQVQTLMNAPGKGIDAPNGSPEYARTWCTSIGVPWSMLGKKTINIRQGPYTVVFDTSLRVGPRYIYIDGQNHPDEEAFDFTPLGNSIGKWQGDTLVSDTRYFEDGIAVIPGGALRTRKSHLVERIRLVDHDTLEIVSTWTDPDTLLKPQTYRSVFKRAKGTVWMEEAICNPVPAMRQKGLHVPYDAPQ